MNLVKLHIYCKINTPQRLFKAIVVTAVFLWPVIILSSCNVINPDESIPAYIHIDTIGLTVNPVTDGSASCKITDAWVYSNGDLLGVYELPCTFPVLQEGENDITIKAGIKMNGIAGSRAYYPFYAPYEQRIDLQPDVTFNLHPSVTYYSDKVHFNEDFEDGGILFEKFGDSDTTIIKTSASGCVFEGAYSGIINLNSACDHAISATSTGYELPKTGTPVFLEMNYKTNNSFRVGLYAITGGQSIKNELITLNTTDTWNKIYINLTSICSSNQSASNFKLYFEVYKETGIENAVILLDNIKLVYND